MLYLMKLCQNYTVPVRYKRHWWSKWLDGTARVSAIKTFVTNEPYIPAKDYSYLFDDESVELEIRSGRFQIRDPEHGVLSTRPFQVGKARSGFAPSKDGPNYTIALIDLCNFVPAEFALKHLPLSVIKEYLNGSSDAGESSQSGSFYINIDNDVDIPVISMEDCR